MLIAVSLLAGWVGQALLLAGFKNFPTSAIKDMLLGNWNPEAWQLAAPPGGQPVIPGTPTPPATRQAPGQITPSTPGGIHGAA